MRRLCRFFVILILACTVAACSEPEDTVDIMWAVMNQLEYKTGDTFMPKRDLVVWTSYQGEVEEISLSKVKICISEPPYRPDEQKEVTLETGYKLVTKGTNLVIVEYLGISAVSPIEVVMPPENGTSIGIEWDE